MANVVTILEVHHAAIVLRFDYVLTKTQRQITIFQLHNVAFAVENHGV